MSKKILSAIAVCTLFLIVKCGTNTQPGNTDQTAVTKKDTVDNGIGQFKQVQLTHPLDEGMVSKGEGIYKAKCFACHKLTEEKLVGPGWKGVTDRRTPEWIMNFITNTDMMLDKDIVAQQLMVVCIARMPNQNVSNDDARFVLEYIRKNDGKN
jgi:mono/diheme cytochrome c family protein